jgi:hypothetical protein
MKDGEIPKDVGFTFGYTPALGTAWRQGCTCAWGARGIYEYGSFSLLHDRQSWWTPKDMPEDEALARRQAHSKYMNDGPLRKAGEKLRRLSKECRCMEDSTEVFVLYEDDRCRIEGSPNGSFGYFYLAGIDKTGMDTEAAVANG